MSFVLKYGFVFGLVALLSLFKSNTVLAQDCCPAPKMMSSSTYLYTIFCTKGNSTIGIDGVGHSFCEACMDAYGKKPSDYTNCHPLPCPCPPDPAPAPRCCAEQFNLWQVTYTCCGSDGNTYTFKALGKTFACAFVRAQSEAKKLMPCGVRCCSSNYTIDIRPSSPEPRCGILKRLFRR